MCFTAPRRPQSIDRATAGGDGGKGLAHPLPYTAGSRPDVEGNLSGRSVALRLPTVVVCGNRRWIRTPQRERAAPFACSADNSNNAFRSDTRSDRISFVICLDISRPIQPTYEMCCFQKFLF